MRLLLDTCVSPRTRDALVRDGHDVVWAGDGQPGPGDRAMMDVALTEGCVLVTLDKDFGAQPWRFGVSDYVAAGGRRLEGAAGGGALG